MKCKFNRKITCFDCFRGCLTCTYRNNSLLTAFTDNIYNDDLTDIRSVKYFCPFCLNNDKLSNFSQETSKMMKCPECGIEFHESTLKYVNTLEPAGLARWVWTYPRHEFFRKVSFEKWNNRLFLLGISQDFWNAYNIIKGTSRDDYDAD